MNWKKQKTSMTGSPQEIFSLDRLRQRWSRDPAAPSPAVQPAAQTRPAKRETRLDLFVRLRKMVLAEAALQTESRAMLANQLTEIEDMIRQMEQGAAGEAEEMELQSRLMLLEDLLEAVLLSGEQR